MITSMYQVYNTSFQHKEQQGNTTMIYLQAHITAGNITLGKMHKNYTSLPLELFRALVVGAKYLPLCQYAKMV